MAVALLERASRRGERALFLVHRREIVRDVRDRLAERGIDAGLILSEEPNTPARVQVASVQTLLQSSARGFRLVVVDEAHHYLADEWHATLRRVGKGARLVGFTATPQRQDGKPLGDVFDELIDVVSYSELVRDGHLVPCRVLRAPAPLGADLAMSPAAAYLQHARGSSAFVFESTALRGRATAAELRAAGVRAEFVMWTMRRDERDAIVRRLQSGELQVVVNLYTMTEGVDVPRVNTIVLARPCRFAGAYIQIVGRALRAHRGKREALLLDLTGASYLHGLPITDRAYALHGKRPIAFSGDDVSEYRAAPKERGASTVLALGLVEADEASQRAHGRRVVDWSKQPLGKATDREIATAVGVSSAQVRLERLARGIPPYGGERKKPIDWDACKQLGKIPDRELAEQLGVDVNVVGAARKRRAIPLFHAWIPEAFWDDKPLGKVADAELAAQLGVDKRAVARARRRRGLAAVEPWVDWDAEPQLGRVPDRELAEKYGVSRNTVASARVRRLGSSRARSCTGLD